MCEIERFYRFTQMVKDRDREILLMCKNGERYRWRDFIDVQK